MLRTGRQENPRPRERSSQKEHQAVVETIAGGLAAGGETTSGRKHYVREARQGPNPGAWIPDKREEITFTTEDLEGVLLPHDDPLMINATIGNCLVKRLMVDTGNFVEVLFLDAYQKMGLDRSRLRPMRESLAGFTGQGYRSEGIINLPLTLADGDKSATIHANFIVMSLPSSYNGIIGQVALNRFLAVPSTYHQVLKFPTNGGIAALRGSQLSARECYEASLRPKFTNWMPGLEAKEEEED